MHPLGSEHREASGSACSQSSLVSDFSDAPSGQMDSQRADSTPETFCLGGENGALLLGGCSPTGGPWGARARPPGLPWFSRPGVSGDGAGSTPAQGCVSSILRGENGTEYRGDTPPTHLLVQLLPLANHSRPPLAPHLLLSMSGEGESSDW